MILSLLWDRDNLFLTWRNTHMENENTQLQTENENTQSHDETPGAGTTSQNAAATTAQNDGKGKLWAEIGMGIVGIIAAFVLVSLIDFLIPFSCSSTEGNYFLICDFLVYDMPFFLLTILCVAEGVRFAGVRTGGHKKRKGCYIGAAICAVIAAVHSIIYQQMRISGSIPRYDSSVGMAHVCVYTILILAGAIIGYRVSAIIGKRKDAK